MQVSPIIYQITPNDFFNLYEALLKRWPGCPIPFMPEKKVIGAKDIAFLQDRTFYL